MFTIGKDYILNMDELKALEMIRNEFEDVIITPRMTFEELLDYAKRKYHLIPCMCRDLGLSETYTDFLAEKELPSYARQNGIEVRQDAIRWHVFKVPYPEIIAGFLYHAHGPAEYWGTTYLIFEESTGFIHSNYDALVYELFYARGISPDEIFCNDIRDISFSAKKYLENLYVWQNNILSEFEFQLKNSMKRINETLHHK